MKNIKRINYLFSSALVAALVTLPALGGEAPKAKGKAVTQTTCPVSGEKLGSMGKPYVHKHKDREVQFCCKGCVKDFEKDPAAHLKKLDAAAKSKAPAKSEGNHAGHKH